MRCVNLLFYCTWGFKFCVSCGTPGTFLQGGGKVAGANVFVNKTCVKAVAAGGGVERGDFFGWALGELAASRCVCGVAASCYYDDVVESPAFFCYGLLQRLVCKVWEGSAEFFFVDFDYVWHGSG